MGTPSEKQIRSGTYGTIFKFTDNLGKLYAKKVIPKLRKIPSDEFLDNTINIAREIALWQCLSGIPNVVPLLGHKELEDSQTVELTMPYFSGGDLMDLMSKKGILTEEASALICASLARFLHSAHKRCIMHRDIKPENIFLESEVDFEDVYVGDFGFAILFQKGEKHLDMAGTVAYMSPNMLMGCYGPQTDLWSLGIVLYFLLSGQLPFQGRSDEEIMQKIMLTSTVDMRSDPWPSISESAKTLVLGLLDRDEESRFSALDVLSHPWIKKFQDQRNSSQRKQ